MELKRGWTDGRFAYMRPFNRTTMELKHSQMPTIATKPQTLLIVPLWN